MADSGRIAAVIAAAGLSRRMGRPKQLLPWGDSTVIATVVGRLSSAGLDPIVVVTGHEAEAVAEALLAVQAELVHNSAYADSELLDSLQVGLRYLGDYDDISGAMLSLGDQPHIPVTVLKQIVVCAQENPDHIAIPSYAHRRGHPIYLPRSLWDEVQSLDSDATLRTVMNADPSRIVYAEVDSPSVLQDLDTPEDYEALAP